MASDSLRLPIFILALIIYGRSLIKADLIFEDGYTVTTVVDGNQININPHSILPRSGQSSDIVVLDSASSVFYTLSRPLSQGSVVNRFSGTGVAGFSDGDVGSAMFNKPRSFAVDLKGNIYVADRSNLAVRKIGASGVTTVAGGLSKKPGHADGPGRNASFSDDFEITFLSDICALLVSDHGNKLIRQINLKSEDCSRSSQSGLSVGASWALGLVVSLLGFIGGFVARPYFISNGGFTVIRFMEIWSHYYQVRPKNQVPMPCFVTRSVLASTALISASKKLLLLCFSHLSLMSNLVLKKRSASVVVNKQFVSLLDTDSLVHSESSVSEKYAEQLNDLVIFDGNLGSLDASDHISHQEMKEKDDGFCDDWGKIDSMMRENVTSFGDDAQNSIMPELIGGSVLVKRR